MRSRYNILTVFFALFMLAIGTGVAAQDMQQQFKTFKGEASKWQEYTMFKHNKIDEFWGVVSDTLAKNQRDLRVANQKIKAQSIKLDSLGAALRNINSELEASENVNATIGFLGIQVNKVFYNVLIWSIIAGLCIAVGLVYVMFKSANKITRATKSECSQLSQEFSDYKEKSTKKQIALKRELQTAINTLEENRIKVSNKLGYNKGSSTIS